MTAVGSGLTDPMTTRGDIIVRNASNVTARLAIGTAGKVPLSDGTDVAYGYPTGVRWTAGTSMPGSPSTNDRVTRTDIMGGMDFVYDGTRWRSVQVFDSIWAFEQMAGTPNQTFGNPSASTGPFARNVLWEPTYGVYLLDFRAVTAALSTNDASNFWTVSIFQDSNNSSIASFTTSGDGNAAALTNHLAAVNAASTEKGVYVNLAKTGAPGSLYLWPRLTYQIIGT